MSESDKQRSSGRAAARHGRVPADEVGLRGRAPGLGGGAAARTRRDRQEDLPRHPARPAAGRARRDDVFSRSAWWPRCSSTSPSPTARSRSASRGWCVAAGSALYLREAAGYEAEVEVLHAPEPSPTRTWVATWRTSPTSSSSTPASPSRSAPMACSPSCRPRTPSLRRHARGGASHPDRREAEAPRDRQPPGAPAAAQRPPRHRDREAQHRPAPQRQGQEADGEGAAGVLPLARRSRRSTRSSGAPTPRRSSRSSPSVSRRPGCRRRSRRRRSPS